MPEDEVPDKKPPNNEIDFLKLPEAEEDILGGMVLKSLSEQNVSNVRKVISNNSLLLFF